MDVGRQRGVDTGIRQLGKDREMYTRRIVCRKKGWIERYIDKEDRGLLKGRKGWTDRAMEGSWKEWRDIGKNGENTDGMAGMMEMEP